MFVVRGALVPVPSICYFCLSTFKGKGAFVLRRNHNMTKGIGKPHQTFFVNYPEMTFG